VHLFFAVAISFARLTATAILLQCLLQPCLDMLHVFHMLFFTGVTRGKCEGEGGVGHSQEGYRNVILVVGGWLISAVIFRVVWVHDIEHKVCDAIKWHRIEEDDRASLFL